MILRRPLEREGRVILPADEYGLLERYWINPDCDCRQVMFQVVARAPRRTSPRSPTASTRPHPTTRSRPKRSSTPSTPRRSGRRPCWSCSAASSCPTPPTTPACCRTTKWSAPRWQTRITRPKSASPRPGPGPPYRCRATNSNFPSSLPAAPSHRLPGAAGKRSGGEQPAASPHMSSRRAHREDLFAGTTAMEAARAASPPTPSIASPETLLEASNHPPRLHPRALEVRLQPPGQLREVMARHLRVQVVLEVVRQFQE